MFWVRAILDLLQMLHALNVHNYLFLTYLYLTFGPSNLKQGLAASLTRKLLASSWGLAPLLNIPVNSC